MGGYKNDDENNVYIMNKDNSLTKIYENEKFILPNIPYIKEHTEKLFKKFGLLDSENGYTSAHYGVDYDSVKTGDMETFIVSIMRWRRCNGYCVIQMSDLGVRYLVYLISKTNHSAMSFGTSPQVVDKKQVLQEFKKLKEKGLQEPVQSIVNSYDFEEYFGLQ